MSEPCFPDYYDYPKGVCQESRNEIGPDGFCGPHRPPSDMSAEKDMKVEGDAFLRLRFFRDLREGQRREVFTDLALIDDADTLNHGIERRLFDLLLKQGRRDVIKRALDAAPLREALHEEALIEAFADSDGLVSKPRIARLVRRYLRHLSVHGVRISPMPSDSRRDGTREQQLLWRIEALREALQQVHTCAGLAGAKAGALNALVVDDAHASEMRLTEGTTGRG